MHDRDTIVNRVTNDDLCQGDMLIEENECFIYVKHLSGPKEDRLS